MKTHAWRNTGIAREGADDPLGEADGGVPISAPISAPANSDAAGGRAGLPPFRPSGVRARPSIDLGVFALGAEWTDAEGAEPTLDTGSVVGGRYRLEEMLGEGGMGQVWSAFDEVLLRTVAVKWANDDDADLRIEREARIAASVDSPHVTSIFDFGLHAGARYLVMELLVGEDLDQRLAVTPELSPEAVVELAYQAGRALDAIHAVGVVHRDVSPSNLFFKRTTTGEALVLIDFGIARAEGDVSPKITLDGHALGCPDYIAPEQMTGAPDLDGRADLFSLAVIVYLALVGALPFHDAQNATSRAYTTSSPARKRLLACNPRLDGFFMRALALDPAARFATGEAMATALHARLADR